MFVVVAYDVANDRRRARLRSVLRTYGTPVQDSVFECEVSRADAMRMKRAVRQTIRKKVDRVRFYPLCAGCRDQVEDEVGPVAVETPLALLAQDMPAIGNPRECA